jgi:hemoglobin
MRRLQVPQWACAIGLVALTGCAAYETTPADSLYDRLGGKAAITAVVDEFVAKVAADNRINGRFATTDIPKLKRHLVDQICAASGGPCVYTGRDMKTTHAGMRLTNADFNALVQDLVSALDKFKVGEREKQELLALLSPMRKDIVEIP